MFDRNDPVGAMAKKMGELFAITVDEMNKAFGEEQGMAVARRAVQRFGQLRGSRIREAVLAAGEELTLENMEKYYDLPANNGWDADTVIENDVLTEDTRYCPLADAWRGLGLEKEGGVYCEIDVAIHQAYLGKMKFERPAIFSDGPEAPCKMIVTRIPE